MSDQSNDRFFPNRNDFKTHEQWDAHVQAYTHIYDLQDKMTAALAQLEQHTKDIQLNTSNIRLNRAVDNIHGLSIKNSIPTNGQKLTFNSVTGQVEWQ